MLALLLALLMPTPTFLTGFPHGVAVTGATPSPNDRIWHAMVTTGGAPTIETTGAVGASGSAFRCPGNGAASYGGRNTSGSPNVLVLSGYILFEGSLPDADTNLFAGVASASNFGFLRFNVEDSKLYAALSSTIMGATGHTVVPDTWYLVDLKVDMSANPRTVDLTVNGTAYGQASAALAAGTIPSWRLGTNVDTTTATGPVRYRDLVISQTSGDYPMGPHEVLKMSPNADGTHSFTAGDFIRGDSGAAILVSDTDVWTLVDDVPFGAIGTTDSIQQDVIRSTGYVELGFEASPSAEDAWGIQVHHQYDCQATGASTITSKLNDGGTLQDLHANADVSNTTATYLSECAPTAPSGGAWTQAKLDALKLRWGFSTDVTGSPILHALMIEAAFPVVGGGGGGLSVPLAMHHHKMLAAA